MINSLIRGRFQSGKLSQIKINNKLIDYYRFIVEIKYFIPNAVPKKINPYDVLESYKIELIEFCVYNNQAASLSKILNHGMFVEICADKIVDFNSENKVPGLIYKCLDLKILSRRNDIDAIKDINYPMLNQIKPLEQIFAKTKEKSETPPNELNKKEFKTDIKRNKYDKSYALPDNPLDDLIPF